MRVSTLLICTGLTFLTGFAADDVLILKNGDKISGEIKRMEQGLIHIDADYGDNIFVIEWDQVERIESSANFVARTSQGTRLTGSVRSDPAASGQVLVEEPDQVVALRQEELVELKPVDEGFWGRFGASVDFGLSLTKANETKQFNTRASASYLAENWSLDGSVNSLLNAREDVENTRRTESEVSYRRFLTDRWFGIGLGSFLQSDELDLNLRSSLGGGAGRYLIQNNRWQFSVQAGALWTNENFIDPALSDQNSAEAFGGIDVNAFDIGDIDVITRFSILPSLTQAGRVRLNFSTDFKWDLPKDLYFSVGFTDNYDSDPASDGPKNDYIFNTSVGWSY